jgi:beta-aspartyl-peptidase (threonine type)
MVYDSMRPAIFLHGGSGSWTGKDTNKALKILEKAATTGLSTMEEGGSAVDAVEKSINHLEISGDFIAGRGSLPQFDGVIRIDAGIAYGKTGKVGAVASIEDVIKPVSVARKVMEETDYVLLVGSGATEFAKEHGFFCRINKSKKSYTNSCETVGAVACDFNGNLAAGSSTGGLPDALPGRVGDAPIFGAGFYVNKHAAAACTGKGEYFIKTLLAEHACNLVANGLKPDEATKQSMKYLVNRCGIEAWGGIIVLDCNGNYGYDHNTEKMPICYKSIDRLK